MTFNFKEKIMGMLVLCVLMISICGCGNAHEKEQRLRYATMQTMNMGFRGGLSGCDMLVKYGPLDLVYFEDAYKRELLVQDKKFYEMDYYKDSATVKRKYAVHLGKCFFDYKMVSYSPEIVDPKNYSRLQMKGDLPLFLVASRLDGVSNVIYNVTYICSIPHKIFIMSKFIDSPEHWLSAAFDIIVGGLYALFMTVFGFIIGTVCHPLETFSNMFAGVILWPPDSVSWFSKEHIAAWKDYFFNTNFFASLWDLVFHAFIYPLWEAIRFLFS